MKLSVAAGLLTQVLPVVSDTKLSVWLSSQNRRNLQANKESRGVNVGAADSGTSPHNQKWSNRVNSRLVRINSNRKLNRFSTTSTLAKQPGVALDLKEVVVCDPTSIDPDVGVLSCGSGNMCSPSHKSVLGGVCIPKRGQTTPRVQTVKEAKAQKRVSDRATARRLKNDAMVDHNYRVCDPSSSDPDVGVLSCSNGQLCKPSNKSPLGGECRDPVNTRDGSGTGIDKSGRFGWRFKKGPLKNLEIPRSKAAQISPHKECDPTVGDVGILTCGVDESCIRSDESVLGGFCAQTTSRRLSYYSTSSLCESSSYLGSLYDCDCDNFDNTTKTGSIVCTIQEGCMGSLYYGCYATCGSRSVAYEVQNDELTSFKYCLNFVSPRSETFCISYNYSSMNTDCEAEFNNEACNTCNDFDFDCANIAGGPVSTYGGLISSLPIIKECYQDVDGGFCTLCTYGTIIPPMNHDKSIVLSGFGDNFTCYGLYDAGIYGQISTAKCPEAAALAQSSCCVYQCSVCGWSDVIPSKNNATAVTLSGGSTTCGTLNSRANNFSISEEECPAVSTAAAESCCEARCNVCNTSFIPYSMFDTPITVAGFDQITTCGELDSAVYIDFTITGDSCSSVAEAIASTCCGNWDYYFCDICGPYKSIAYDYYGVSLTDVPGIGNTTCEDISVAAYWNSSLTSETCPVVGASVRDKCCREYMCSVCGPNAIIPLAFDGIITTYPGIGDISCYEIYAEAYYGRAQNLSCDALSEAAHESCCLAPYMSCDVCGPTAYMSPKYHSVSVTVPYDGLSTCYLVYFGSYLDGSVSKEMCSTVSTAVKESCCRDLNPTSSTICSICGNGNLIAKPDANISFSNKGVWKTCSELGNQAKRGSYNSSDCDYFQLLVNDICC